MRVIPFLLNELIEKREFEECLPLLTELKKLGDKTNSKKAIGTYHIMKGRSLFFSNRAGIAKGNFDSAYAIFKELNDADGLLQASYCLGMIDFGRGEIYKATLRFRSALPITGKVKNKRTLSNFYSNYVAVLLNQHLDSEATVNLRISEEIAAKHHRKNLVNVYTSWSSIYFSKGLYQDGLKYMFKALGIAEESDDRRSMGAIYNNIASSYINLGNFNEGKKYILLSLRCCEEVKDLHMMASANFNLGNICGQQRQYDSAWKYFSRAHEIALASGDQINIAEGCEKMAEILVDRDKNYPEAIKKYDEAIKIYESLQNATEVAKIQISLSRCLIKKKEFSRAEALLNKALEVLIAANDVPIVGYSYSLFAYLKEEQKDYKEALRYQKLYKRFSDSLLSQQNASTLNQAQLQYEFSKKEALAGAEHEKQAALASAEIKRQQQMRNTFIAGFAVVLLLLVAIFRSLRVNMKKNRIISLQKKVVEEKQKEILDSITYARRIQESLLPTQKYLKKTFSRLTGKSS